MPSPERARRVDSQPAREAPRAGVGAGQHASLLALQSTAGNSVVSRLVADRVQRLPAAADVADIGGRLRKVVEALKTDPNKISEQATAIADLARDSVAGGLDQSNAAAHNVIVRLRTLSLQTPTDATAVGQVIQGFDPARADFGAAAAATFTPRVSKAGTGPGAGTTQAPSGPSARPEDAAMQALEQEERRQHTAQGSIIKARITLTVQALAKAYARHHSRQRDRRTLLVFVGGEFWFRRTDGPCTRDERDEVLDAFKDVSSLYPDALIMPGTIVSGDQIKGLGPPIWLRIQNTAAIFWNGSLIHSVDKATDAGTTDGVAAVTSATDVAKAQLKGTGPSFTTLGAVRIAMEICADHDGQRAKNEGGHADLHLVTGWGQSVQPKKTVLGPGSRGLAVSADSSGSGGSAWTQQPGGAPTRTMNPDRLMPDGSWQPAPFMQEMKATQTYAEPVPIGAPAAPAPAPAAAAPAPPAFVVVGQGGDVIEERD